MKSRARDRSAEVIKKLNVEKLPFKLNSKNIASIALDVSEELLKILGGTNISPSLKWCFSTIKKTKVFILIYRGNESGESIYKEEIAKKLPEYSYKTIATIIDEGLAKNYYVALDPFEKDISDKKIKNIRPSFELITSFYNWNIDRIVYVDNLIKKNK